MNEPAASPTSLIAEVRRLIDTVTAPSQGVWARSAALLARQALEVAVRVRLDAYSTGLDNAPFRAQLLCLQGVIGDNDVAREAHYVWSALSSATHHSGYELAPTAADLREWLAGVERVVAVLERRVISFMMKRPLGLAGFFAAIWPLSWRAGRARAWQSCALGSTNRDRLS